MVGSCWRLTHLQLHKMLSAELPGSRSRWRRYVRQLCEQLFVRANSFLNIRDFYLGSSRSSLLFSRYLPSRYWDNRLLQARTRPHLLASWLMWAAIVSMSIAPVLETPLS